MTRLLVELFWAEDIFQERLAGTHIWNEIKMEKRIRIFDVQTCGKKSMRAVFRETEDKTNDLRRRFESYSIRMRDLYAHRYLVDWRRQTRVWDQLYFVVSDKGPPGVDQSTIGELLKWSASGSELAAVCFGVHPLHEFEIEPDTRCAICIETYKADDMIMQLRGCKH